MTTVRRVVVDHMTLPVADLAASRAFYGAVLAPLGMGEVRAADGEIGFGPEGLDDFTVREGGPAAANLSLHVAFAARTTAEVDGFHAAALAAGGTDNGAPGPRPAYGPGYYGAFVLDPDGHNVEAVFHAP